MRCTKSPCDRFPTMIHARNSTLCEILRIAAMAADSDAPVLLLGDTGTGKDVLASAIHGASARAGRPFIEVNCPTLPWGLADSELFGVVAGYAGLHNAGRQQQGRFDLANNGTIFLNEIGDFPPEAQPKLNEVLERGRFTRLGGVAVSVNVRVIAATLLPEKIRDDLRGRLETFTIDIPPLRARKCDIPELAGYFADGKRISSDVYDRLVGYEWPLNVRQLRNAMLFALASCRDRDEITLADLPTYVGASRRRAQRLKDQSLTGLGLDDVSSGFPFSPGLVLPEIVSAEHAWRRDLGAPRVVIIDDHATNRRNYSEASTYLRQRIRDRSGCQSFEPIVSVISPDDLQLDFRAVYKMLKSCVLLVLDLDFSDAHRWKNGFVLMGYAITACPWLRDSVLWVTQTGEDVFQESYLREAIQEIEMTPELAPRVRDLLSGPVHAHPAIIGGRPRRPIPPFGSHLEPDETEWWWNLGGHMGEILGNQKRAIGLWLNDHEGLTADSSNAEDREGNKAVAAPGGTVLSKRDPPYGGPLLASTVIGWIVNEIKNGAPTTAILEAFVAVWNQRQDDLRSVLPVSSWKKEFHKKLPRALLDRKLQTSRGEVKAADVGVIAERVRQGWKDWCDRGGVVAQ